MRSFLPQVLLHAYYVLSLHTVGTHFFSMCVYKVYNSEQRKDPASKALIVVLDLLNLLAKQSYREKGRGRERDVASTGSLPNAQSSRRLGQAKGRSKNCECLTWWQGPTCLSHYPLPLRCISRKLGLKHSRTQTSTPMWDAGVPKAV